MGIIDWYFQRKKKKLNPEIAPKPTISVPEKDIERGFDALNDMLEYNLAPPVGDLPDFWTRPAPKFPGAYLWDSSFITQAWKLRDPEIGLRALKVFVEFQQEDGRMPHMVFWGKKVSPLSNPPFLAWAVNDLLQYKPDQKWANYYYPALIKFVNWRKEQRYDEAHGLYFWEHSYESGIDNSPRFTSQDESEDYGVKNLGAIDLNAEIALQHQSILEILRKYDPENTHITELEEERERIEGRVHHILWDSEKEVFGDYDMQEGTLRTHDTIASYFPLVFNDLRESMGKAMQTTLFDPKKYNTKTPLPSVALDTPNFVKDMWRGPVWVNTSYLVVRGMEKQGWNEMAGDFAYKLARGIFKTWNNEGHFYEFYDPERWDLKELHRKKGNLWKQISLGSKPVIDFAGWTADAIPLIVENVIGLKKRGGKWIIEPHLPENWFQSQSKRVKLLLPYYQAKLDMDLNDNGTDIDVQVSLRGTNRSIPLKNHEKHKIDELK